MFECMRLLGQRKGEILIGMVQDATGEDCPCIGGKVCPLLDAMTMFAPPVAVRVPAQVVPGEAGAA